MLDYQFTTAYPFFVEYIDEYGVACADTWSADTLNQELALGAVKITHIELSYRVQVALGKPE